MAQLDWVQIQAKKHRQLLELRGIIDKHLRHEQLFSGSAIRITLSMIQRNHGPQAEQETRQMFGLGEKAAA